MLDKMICTESKLVQLKEAGYVNSMFTEDQLEQDEWQAKGHPYCWVLVEIHKAFSCFIDVSYGHIALFENDEFLGVGKYSALYDKAVAMDKDYYGLSHYIFIR